MSKLGQSNNGKFICRENENPIKKSEITHDMTNAISTLKLKLVTTRSKKYYTKTQRI